MADNLNIYSIMCGIGRLNMNELDYQNGNANHTKSPTADAKSSCKTPETGETDSSGDVGANRKEDSYYSSDVSYIDPSLLLLDTDCESIFKTDTDTDGSERVTMSTPKKRASDDSESGGSAKRLKGVANYKRKYETCSETYSDGSEEEIIVLSSDHEDNEFEKGLKLISSPKTGTVITTRSGRAVHARVEFNFDYSSEQCGADDFEDGDTDYDDDYDDEPKCKKQKNRRISLRSSYSSSDNSSLCDSTSIIYLDLTKPTAIIQSEPPDISVADQDCELKVLIQKFLGLVAAKRRLYTPTDDLDVEENETSEVKVPRFHSFMKSGPPPSPGAPVSIKVIPATPATFDLANNSKLLNSPRRPTTQSERQVKVFNDMVLRANANHLENNTPAHIKEAIDLSGLPSKSQRSQNCRQHRHIYDCLESHPRFYTFIESLNSETSINMCHPDALIHRERDFSTNKETLAKTLFHMLNHKIFHCGLKPVIVWARSMSSSSKCVHSIKAGSGQRESKIMLSKNISHVSVLIKAMLHEMCHAAAFVYHGETGHGDFTRKWAYQAKSQMPELPAIADCMPNYKYSCCLCRRRSFGNIKFEDESDQLRCHYCQFELIVEPHAGDFVHSLSFGHQKPTPYKDFVKKQYLQTTESGHSAKMKAVNTLYLATALSVNRGGERSDESSSMGTGKL
ncbi:uncharacterized protein LOC115627202 [Scaptodrosophila lebanonensis]|uniref:Uncharacterized protein LOC115627202 n=1 Tax=Drosophila lebanonensis TaxID=7225 RepID=A0A6J2TSY4_DROLE|nr:uncharacterized protein LOC115627202 [Scaptodrosophila lebanonensis]